MMRISSVLLQNYRQYQNLDIKFTQKGKCDLHFLLVENGIGKTTLLNAINWCLYADEPHIGIKDQALPLINLATFRNMQPGKTEDIKVILEIEIQTGTVRFERCWTVRKTEENMDYVINKSWKAISCFAGQCANVYEGEEADRYVNKFVPKRIRKFFFFDGEQMDTYFTDETGLNVEQSIFEISQIDLLNSIHKNLHTISNDLRRSSANLTPKVSGINEKYEAMEKSLSEEEDRVNDINKQLYLAKNELRLRSEELGEEPDLAELESERDIKNKEITKCDLEKRDAEENLKILIKKYSILFNALPRLQKLYLIIKEKQENKQLPPKIDKDELEKMLADHHCAVCDRDLDGKSMTHIEELISKYELNNESAILLTSIRGNIQSMINNASGYIKERNFVMGNINLIEDNWKKAIFRFNEIDSIIEKYTDKDRIIKLHKERRAFEEQIKSLEKDSIIGEENIKKLKSDIDKIKEQLDKEFEKNKQHNSMIREKDLAEKATNVISSIISEIKNGVRKKISDEMNKMFFQLNWKKDTFNDIRLNDAYRISLINIDGFECLGTCSAAERELLALSFTLALHKESGFDGPLVIDTPISRISGILRTNFAKCLREVSEFKQIILFLTEDEYSIQVKDIFEPCASSKYALTLKDENLVEMRSL